MERDIAKEDAGQQQAEVDLVSLLLTEMEIVEQDILELFLPVRYGLKDILDHVLFVAGNDE